MKHDSFVLFRDDLAMRQVSALDAENERQEKLNHTIMRESQHKNALNQQLINESKKRIELYNTLINAIKDFFY